MSYEIGKYEGGQQAISALRSLLSEEGHGGLAIAKTAVKDGAKGLVARGISVLQRWNEERFGAALLRELEDMRDAGRIRDDFNRTDAGVSSLREFFEFIDGKPDEPPFRAFCALFMSANAPEADANEAILDLELMGILRQLTAGEMHLLSAFLKAPAYTIGKGNSLDAVKEALGLNSTALIDKNVTSLRAHHLVSEDTWKQRGGSVGEIKPWLTDLGVLLAERVKKYNEFKASSHGKSAEARSATS